MRMLILFLAAMSIAHLSAAWEDCQKGLVNDTYPGSCGSYVDTDRDGICDRSQPPPEEREAILAANLSASPALQPAPDAQAPAASGQGGKDYYLLPVSAALLAAYLASWLALGRKPATLVLHRRIWNLALLASFLVSGLLGILLVLRADFGFNPQLPFSMLFAHVEAGIAMALVALFHILWHMDYFKAMLKA